MNLKRFLLISYILSFLLSSACESSDDHLTERVQVTVDFAVPVPDVKSMSGFLHGINNDQPVDSLITLLEPKLLRSGSGYESAYPRKARFSSKHILVLSDLWYNGPGKRFSVMPYDNYEVYREFVKEVAILTQGNFIYDVWNEPDNDFIWRGSREQFYESFKIAHDAIRSELGDQAIISGPSTHWFPTWINEFAYYCDNNDIQLDVFSYHELHETNNPYSVQQHLRSLRDIVYNQSTNLAKSVKEIHVNEYGYHGSQHNPAQILGYLYHLEQGEADGACRACWKDEDGVSTCWTGTIGGLLTRDELKPRASWWTHRLYAESIAKRVHSNTNVSFVANFAYQTASRNQAKVLVANSHRQEIIQEMSVVLSNLRALPFVGQADASILVRVYEIPDTGEAVLEEPIFKQEQSHTIDKNEVEITFSGIDPLTTLVLEIRQDI